MKKNEFTFQELIKKLKDKKEDGWVTTKILEKEGISYGEVFIYDKFLLEDDLQTGYIIIHLKEGLMSFPSYEPNEISNRIFLLEEKKPVTVDSVWDFKEEYKMPDKWVETQTSGVVVKNENKKEVIDYLEKQQKLRLLFKPNFI